MTDRTRGVPVAEQARPAVAPDRATATRVWSWGAVWLGVALATGVVVRLSGPAVLDPDEHAAALYFRRLVAGQRLEDPLLSTPKPLLTLVHGLAWAATSDWRALTALTVAAFALAVTALARAAGRLGGAPAAAATVVAVAGSGPLVLQVARGNSVVWALAGWALALDALARPRRRYGLAAAALLLAALARTETWLLLPLAAGGGALLAWRGRDRRALLLLVPLAAPLLWLGHDRLLTGDALYSLRVPERYTDLVAGRHPVDPAAWLGQLTDRYAAMPLALVLAAAGVAWLLRRRAWPWLAGLAALVPGLLVLFGAYAARGTYVSWRYFDPPDLGVHLAAALGAGWLARAGAERLRGRPGRGWWGSAGAVAAAVLLVGAAGWPLAPVDPVVRSTLDRDTRLSANAAAAVAELRPFAERPGAVVVASGPQRVRVALELDLPLGRVRDLYLAALHAPLDRALAGSVAVYHDADGDRPAERFAPLSADTPARVGALRVVPVHADPERGLYVLAVEDG
ncbi:MAG TPA: hypothetical protein VF486_26320 [Actinomycetes bacterium]